MIVIVFLFWFFIALMFYIYFGYPLFIMGIGLFKPHPVKRADITPHVIIITAAYNEANHCEATIRNKFESDYPRDKISYVFVSDASDDQTDAIVKGLQAEYPNLHFIRQTERQGKTAALNRAIQWIKESRPQTIDDRPGSHENLVSDSSSNISVASCIVIFSDANSIYKPDAIKNLVRNFADEKVGYVTGKMVYITHHGSAVSEGCGAYMKYENKLREWETRAGSIVGADGGIDALRLDLYQDMDASDLPDFVMPLRVVSMGYRVVYESQAILREEALNTHSSEFGMRVRVAIRSYYALLKNKCLFDWKRYGIYSFELLSHKVLRYLAGFFQIIIFCLNISLLSHEPIYIVFFIIQLAFYAAAFRGYQLEYSNRQSGILYVPYYFCMLNFASLIAVFKMCAGEKPVIWKPRLG
jgi:cellulose synthase/poly-beta-1,6-N-acetylglucosamine synthase-like glycosyltransferase